MSAPAAVGTPAATPAATELPAWLSLTLLWLAGAGLRITLLAVPPVLPALRGDLGLSGTGVGILGGIPMALFALAAVPGSLIVARVGVRRTLIAGLVIVAVGGALRALAGAPLGLFAATIAMSFGIAIMQPAMPAAVRAWQPRRIGFATAVFTNGMLVGETFPPFLSLPVIVPAVGGWRGSLVFWSLPVLATAILMAAVTRRTVGQPGANRGWPDWRQSVIWRLGLMFCGINGMYYGANNFLPDYLTSVGRGHLVSAALSALNFGQVPASLLLLMVARRLERRIWPYVACAAVMLAALTGVVLAENAIASAFFAGLLGFAVGGGFALALTLPPLLRPDDVVRTSAAMFTISYASAVGISVLAGLAWDWSGHPVFAFGPLALCTLLVGGFALTLKFDAPAR